MATMLTTQTIPPRNPCSIEKTSSLANTENAIQRIGRDDDRSAATIAAAATKPGHWTSVIPPLEQFIPKNWSGL